MNIVYGPALNLRHKTRALMGFVVCAACIRAAEPGLIDFRNFIPGVLDAPVYHVIGTNRLSGEAYLAQLYCGTSENSLGPRGSAVPFGANEDAGYWHRRDATLSMTTVYTPFAPGGRVWVRVVAWQLSRHGENYDTRPPPRLWGRSETFSIVISNTPTPLVGLKPFRLEPAPLREIRREGDEVVLRWSAGDGTAHYEVEVTPSLQPPVIWHPVSGQPQLIIMRESGRDWFADWVITNTIVGSTAFYRIGLLDP